MGRAYSNRKIARCGARKDQKMELRYISIKCPICGRIWGSTEEYTEQFSYDAEEVSEYRLCPICRSRKKNVKQTPVEVK